MVNNVLLYNYLCKNKLSWMKRKKIMKRYFFPCYLFSFLMLPLGGSIVYWKWITHSSNRRLIYNELRRHLLFSILLNPFPSTPLLHISIFRSVRKKRCLSWMPRVLGVCCAQMTSTSLRSRFFWSWCWGGRRGEEGTCRVKPRLSSCSGMSGWSS